MKTYGTLARDDQVWTVDAEPHVITRIKRLFARSRHRTPGRIQLSATADIAVDLEWILARYPLEITPADRETLTTEANSARETQQQIHRILEGWKRPEHGVEPARPLRDYQATAADLARTTGRLLLADDVGLGKTTSAAGIFRDPETLPAVVVTLTHLATPGKRRLTGEPRSQWAREINIVFPGLVVHVAKKGTPYPINPPCDVLVINYHKLAGWADWLADAGIRTVVFDECQELRRSTSNKYNAAASIASVATWRLGLSATPIYNYGGELWNVMEVLAPGELGTRDEFTREWCDGTDWTDKTRVRDMAGLSAFLRDQGLMLRRNRIDVGRELPAMEAIVHDVPADSAALNKIADADYLAAALLNNQLGGLERGRAAAEFDMRLRQGTGLAKAPYVAEFVRMLVQQGPVVLYGWHRAVYDIWADQLVDLKPAFYTGTESPVQKHRAADRFIAGETDLLILSLRSGAGIDGLQHRASTVAFGELDWSPGVHEQCIGRIHRDGQTRPVAAFYLVTDTGSDPTVISTLGIKREQVERLREPDSDTFTMAQVDPNRIQQLARDWLQRRGANANTVRTRTPVGSAS